MQPEPIAVRTHIKQKNASDEVMPSLGSSSMRFRPIHARMYLHGEAAL